MSALELARMMLRDGHPWLALQVVVREAIVSAEVRYFPRYSQRKLESELAALHPTTRRIVEAHWRRKYGIKEKAGILESAETGRFTGACTDGERSTARNPHSHGTGRRP